MSFAAAIAALRTLTNPYPGLRPFETSESHLFFGRDQQVAELVARLERDRFLAVVGVSGSGKSSLVRAGLIPALERGRVLEAGRRWRMIITRPGGAPLQRLAGDLERAGLGATPLTQSSHGLIEVARGLASDETLLVLVDQFEELFRYKDLPATTEEARLRRGVSASEAAEFVQLLLEAARHSRPVYIVLTMRSDYLGDCAEFRDLPETLNDCQYLIPRMTRAQRKEAIEVPLGPVAMAPSLTQRLLNDAGDEPDQLPILQHALMRTWARWRAADPEQTRRIELADYESIGGFQNAVDLHADEVLAGVSDQGIAENISSASPRRAAETANGAIPATLDELCAVCGATSPDARVGVMAVIDAFRLGEATFLNPRDGDITGATYVDITHESLIRQWRRLRDVWLPGEQQSAKAFLTLAERARNWDAGKAEPLAGLDLADALEWNRRRNPTVAWAEHYGDAKDLELVLRFIAASKVHDRKLRLRKRQLWITLPLLVVFALLAGVAVWQWFRADELRDESHGGTLLARSQLLLTTDPNLTPSVLLAIEALRRLPSAEAEEALRRAVARVPRQLFQVPLAVAATRQDTPRDKERRDRIVTSRDGRSVAVVADNVHVSVLEAQTGRQIGTMKAPGPVFDIVPGSDGTWMIATAASDGSPSVISFPDGREIRRLTAVGGVTSMALSRDGRYAVTVGADAWRLHDLRDGREVGLPTPLKDGSTPIFSADGNTIAMGGQDAISTPERQETAYRAFVFDTARQKPAIKYTLAGKVQSLALTRDGRFLVAGDAGAARVWDLSDGSEPVRMTTGTPLASVAISDDARVVVTAGADGTTRAFDTHGGSEIARVIVECPEAGPGSAGTAPGARQCGARAVALSPDGRLVLSAGDDARLRVFEPLGASDEARITEDLWVRAIAFARAGRRLVVGSEPDGGQRIRVFDAPEWRERQRIEAKVPEVRGYAVSADGRFVMLASNWTNGPMLFDLDASEKSSRALGGFSNSSSATLSGDGSSAAWIEGQVMRFDQGSGKAVPLPGLTHPQAIALSDDGRTAVVGTGNIEGGEVVVVQLPAGTPTARVPFVAPATFVAISPDGRWVAASRGIQGIGDNIIHVIDASTGQIRWKHAAAPNTPIAFTRDGLTVAMASADGTLRTFDTGSGRETFRIPLEEQPLFALAFDKQAVSLTAASMIRTLTFASGVTVKKYLLRRDDVVTHACSRLSRNLTGPEWTRYVGADVPRNATCDALR